MSSNERLTHENRKRLKQLRKKAEKWVHMSKDPDPTAAVKRAGARAMLVGKILQLGEALLVREQQVSGISLVSANEVQSMVEECFR